MKDKREWCAYYSINRLELDETIVKHPRKIRILGLGYLGEIVHKRSVEEAELVIHPLQISTHVGKRVFPELGKLFSLMSLQSSEKTYFADKKPAGSKGLVERLQ